MIENLACRLGRNDEEPNIELAVMLSENEDKTGIQEIVEGLKGKDKAVASDCMKVLYEIGERKPELAAPYVLDFIALLSSKNNRLVWGSMTALAAITALKSEEVYRNLPAVKKAYEEGSVITIDNSMTVFALLCKADKNYEKEIFPFLLEHLSLCRPKETAQHAERISLCIHRDNCVEFIRVLEQRKPDLADSQIKRLDKLIKRLKGENSIR